MSELKDLVPPLELCKQIPEGKFKDSVLVWANNSKLGFQVMPRIFNTFGDNCEHHYDGIPAPTLQEIIEKIPGAILDNVTAQELPGNMKGRYSISCSKVIHGILVYLVERGRNPATAALKLWLKVKAKG